MISEIVFLLVAVAGALAKYIHETDRSVILITEFFEAFMTIKNRSKVMIAIFVFASILYGTAKYYAPPLILYVVEQSLAQKAPAGTDLTQLHERLHAYLSEIPDQDVRMEKLLRISQHLEKVQQLTHEELDELIKVKKTEPELL